MCVCVCVCVCLCVYIRTYIALIIHTTSTYTGQLQLVRDSHIDNFEKENGKEEKTRISFNYQ